MLKREDPDSESKPRETVAQLSRFSAIWELLRGQTESGLHLRPYGDDIIQILQAASGVQIAVAVYPTDRIVGARAGKQAGQSLAVSTLIILQVKT